MDFLFCLLIVEVMCCASAWMSRKCLVLDEDSPPVPLQNTCPRSQLTANCMDVSNLALDLSAVPHAIQVLCLWCSSRIKLGANGLSQFHHLQSLYIYGCLSEIDPRAFMGLTDLHILSIVSSQHCNAPLPSKVFSDLYRLEDLTLNNYDLSQTAPCDLNSPRRMKRLNVQGKVNVTDLLCKVSCFPTPLESLSIEVVDAEVLRPSTCPHGHSKFPAKNIRVLLRHIKRIEYNAFKCLKNITYLSMPMNNLLQHQILSSGLQQVDHMQLNMTEVNVKQICELVLFLSVDKIDIHFQSFQEYSLSSWAKCAKLQEIFLDGQELTTIDLSFISILNKLKAFSAFLFAHVEDIGTIKVRSLDSLCTMNVSLPSLRTFSYRTSQNLTVSAKQFICASHLKSMLLQGDTVKLDESAFEGLSSMAILWLRSFCFTFESKAFKGLVGLRNFRADGSLYDVPSELFLDLENVETLTFRLLPIQTIQNFTFSNLTQLKHLEITGNGISEIQTNTFSGLRNLESLRMSGHNLKHLEPSCFAHLPSLRVLDLRYSGMQLLNLASIFGGFPHNLSDLTLTSGLGDMTLVIPNDSTPEVDLSLNLSGRKIVLWGCEKPLLKSVTKIQIFSDMFVCAPNNTTPFPHLTSVVDLSFTQWHASTVHKLTSLNRLVKLKRLDLTNINFINLPDIALMFRNLTNLEMLSLSNIWVDSLEVGLVQDMTSLKFLYLGIATEVSISPGFFEHLPSLRFTQIMKIQLRCTCDNVRFIHWAKQQQRVQVNFWKGRDKPLQCMLGRGASHDIERYGQAYCSLDLGHLMFASTSCFLLLFLSTVLLHQLAREYLLAFYHIAHGWMNEALRGRETRHRYQYDAFVSYSGKDEPWVVQTLLPNLEQRGPPFLRLCLHTRDFQLGKDIVENITDGLYRSRRTLCLVSRHFLRSHWCSLEMRLGTYRLQVERRDVLILVFLEKIPSNLLSAHHRLAQLVKTRTYMEWPRDPARQQAFWDRLWNKLLEGRVQ